MTEEKQTSLANTVARQAKLSILYKGLFQRRAKFLNWNWMNTGIAVSVISALSEGRPSELLTSHTEDSIKGNRTKCKIVGLKKSIYT